MTETEGSTSTPAEAVPVSASGMHFLQVYGLANRKGSRVEGNTSLASLSVKKSYEEGLGKKFEGLQRTVAYGPEGAAGGEASSFPGSDVRDDAEGAASVTSSMERDGSSSVSWQDDKASTRLVGVVRREEDEGEDADDASAPLKVKNHAISGTSESPKRSKFKSMGTIVNRVRASLRKKKQRNKPRAKAANQSQEKGTDDSDGLCSPDVVEDLTADFTDTKCGVCVCDLIGLEDEDIFGEADRFDEVKRELVADEDEGSPGNSPRNSRRNSPCEPAREAAPSEETPAAEKLAAAFKDDEGEDSNDEASVEAIDYGDRVAIGYSKPPRKDDKVEDWEFDMSAISTMIDGAVAQSMNLGSQAFEQSVTLGSQAVDQLLSFGGGVCVDQQEPATQTESATSDSGDKSAQPTATVNETDVGPDAKAETISDETNNEVKEEDEKVETHNEVQEAGTLESQEVVLSA